jgi:hypothetical protein
VRECIEPFLPETAFEHDQRQSSGNACARQYEDVDEVIEVVDTVAIAN